MARREDRELTEALLRDAPLELLNADEDKLRAWLRERFEWAAEEYPIWFAADTDMEAHIARAVRLVRAFERAFRHVLAEELHPAALIEAVGELDEAWRAVRGPLEEHFRLMQLDRGLLSNAGDLAAALPDAGSGSVRLRRVSLPGRWGGLSWFSLTKPGEDNTWLELAALLEHVWLERMTEGEARSIFICPICEAVTGRGRSDQVYCSPACAKRAWDIRRGRAAKSE